MMVEDRELLVDASTGKSRVAVPYEPVVSSSSMSWEGFRLEHHRVPEIVANDVYHLNHVVVVMLNVGPMPIWRLSVMYGPIFAEMVPCPIW